VERSTWRPIGPTSTAASSAQAGEVG
jgi:hypothetical protein